MLKIKRINYVLKKLVTQKTVKLIDIKEKHREGLIYR